MIRRFGRFGAAAALAAAMGTLASIGAEAFQAPGQGPRRDGNWQVTMEMEMPGMPQKMPPMNITQCITPEEAADPSKLAPQGRGAGANSCKVLDQKTDGNKVTWSMKCDPPNEMTGTGEFVYSGDTYTGVMKMTMAGGQAMTMKYNGKRLGDCKK